MNILLKHIKHSVNIYVGLRFSNASLNPTPMPSKTSEVYIKIPLACEAAPSVPNTKNCVLPWQHDNVKLKSYNNTHGNTKMIKSIIVTITPMITLKWYIDIIHYGICGMGVFVPYVDLCKRRPVSHINIKTVFPGMEISIMKIKLLWDRFIYLMGIPILVVQEH